MDIKCSDVAVGNNTHAVKGEGMTVKNFFFFLSLIVVNICKCSSMFRIVYQLQGHTDEIFFFFLNPIKL